MKAALGERFGRLVVLGEAAPRRDKHGYPLRRVRVRCDCGVEKEVSAHVWGRTASCTCLRKERVSAAKRLHGEGQAGTYTPEYKAWRRIRQRCEDSNHENYPRYGGRGVRVCDRWRFGESGQNGYELFLLDMGRKPTPKHSIDRIDNDGNYDPGNCRWATPKEQQRNRSDNRVVCYLDRQMTLAEACELSGASYDRAAYRLDTGLPLSAALSLQMLPRGRQATKLKREKGYANWYR